MARRIFRYIPVLLISFFAAGNSSAEQLSSHGCGLQYAANTSHSSKATQITFVNRSKRTLSVNWVNYQRKHVPYGKVAPGTNFTVNTFTEHFWVVKDDTNGKCVGLYLPRSRGAHLVSIR